MKVEPILEKYQICTKCGESKPLSLEFYNSNSSCVDGFTRQCKICLNEQQMLRYRRQNPDYYLHIEEREKLSLEGKQRCTGCLKIKDFSEFNPDIKATKKIATRCFKCQINTKYLQLYGITRLEFIKVVEEQNFICPICKKEIKIGAYQEKGDRFAVLDHCHKTKQNRGALCNKCNAGLGFFDDNLEILKSATNYLKKWIK